MCSSSLYSSIHKTLRNWNVWCHCVCRESETTLLKQTNQSQKTFQSVESHWWHLQRVLLPDWNILCDRVDLSCKAFRTISSSTTISPWRTQFFILSPWLWALQTLVTEECWRWPHFTSQIRMDSSSYSEKKNLLLTAVAAFFFIPKTFKWAYRGFLSLLSRIFPSSLALPQRERQGGGLHF